MKKEVIEALKAALKIKGLNEELYDIFNIDEVSQVEEAVNKVYDKLPKLDNLDVAATLARPEFKSEMDRAITKALTTQQETLKKKWNIKDDPAPTDLKPTDPILDPNVKALIETVNTLKTELETIKTTKTLEQKQNEAAQKLAASKVLTDSFKQKWANRIDVNSETAIEDQIKGLEQEYTEFVQEIANETGYAPGAGKGNPNTTATEQEAKAIIGSVLP